MKRILKITGVAFASLLLAALLTVAAGCLWSLRQSDLSFPAEADLAAGEFLPGDPVAGGLRFELPLRYRVRSVEIHPGEGSVAVGNPEIRWSDWRFSRMEYSIRFELRPFRDGEIPPGKMTLELAGKKRESFPVKIPAFQVSEPAKDDAAEITLADPAVAEREWKPYFWGALALVLIAALITAVFLFRRRKERPAVPPWVRALAALSELRFSLAEHKLPLEEGFVRLTDLVRGYLEERFAIPVSSRTTPEFLRDLDAPGSPLPEKERPFLREFLLAADQVKFAKMQPDAAILRDAIGSAETLVGETTPQENEGGK